MVVKKGKKTKLKARGGKKQWFMVKAPEVYNNREIGEILAFMPNDLLGKNVEVSLKEITGSPRDSSQKIVLKITKVQGGTALTEVQRMFMSESYVQRVSRRSKERIISVFYINSKDKQKIKYKLYILLQKQVVRAVRTAITKQLEGLLKDYVSKKNADELFSIACPRSMSMFFKKELKTIYPCQIIVWKITKVE